MAAAPSGCGHKGDATLRSVWRAPSPSDGAANSPKRQSKQRTNPIKRFSRQKTEKCRPRASTAQARFSRFCLRPVNSQADVDFRTRSTAPRALIAPAKSLRCGEPAGCGPVSARRRPCCAQPGLVPQKPAALRPLHCHARANAACSAGPLTAPVHPQSRATPFRFIRVSRASSRRRPALTGGDCG